MNPGLRHPRRSRVWLSTTVHWQALPTISTLSLCNSRQRLKVMRDTSEVL